MTTAETVTAALRGIEGALRSAMEPEHECDFCERPVRNGRVANIGIFTYHPRCAVAVAAGVAMSVMDGGDEKVSEVRHAADVLEMAVRILRSRIGGRVA